MCRKSVVKRMDFEWKRRLTIIGIAAGVYLGFRYVFPAAIPFLVGWLLAVWLYPLSVKAEKKIKIKKSIVGGALMILLLAAAGFLLCKGTEVFLAQVKSWMENYQLLEHKFYGFVDDCCGALEHITGIQRVDSREFVMDSLNRMQENFSQASPKAWLTAKSFLKGCIAVGSGVVIAIISGMLFLKDMEQMKKKSRDYEVCRRWGRILKRLKKTTITYMKAQLVIMMTIAGICTASLWLMKSPYYLVFGIGLGLLDALPLIGTGLFLYPASIILFIRGNVWIAAGCLITEFATSFTRELLEPRLIGGKLGIYPIVVLAAVYFGFLIYGPMGFVLGPLSLSLLYEIGKEWDVWG